jgi:exopolysaccharide biosynthesis polyprenyl glycosylphosphotransferase
MSSRVLDRYTTACLFLDLLGVVLAVAGAIVLRFSLPLGRTLGPEQGRLATLLFPLALVAWSLAAGQARLYEWRWLLNLRSEVGRLILAVGGTTMLVAGGLYLTYRDISRLLFVYFVVLMFAANGLGRVALRGLLRWRWRDRATVRIAFVGGGRVTASLAGRLLAETRRWPPLVVVGFVEDPERETERQTIPRLGTIDDLPEVVARHGVTMVISTLPSSEHERTAGLVGRLHGLAVDLRVVPDLLDLAYARATISHIEGIPLVGLRDPALSPSSRLIKYTFDRMASLAALVLCTPVFLLIAVAIKLDSRGPVFYGARRVGEAGHPFTMWKFRTMRVGAEAALPEAVGEERLAAGVYKVPGDPRVTRVGRWLRRTSLDELPNLVNVLRGEMSLVGPRPEQLFIVAKYAPWQHRRTSIRPGMTGWWQINGRGDLPMHQHTDFDLYYVENYSLLLDLRILGRTVGAVIAGRGAY